MVQGIMYYGKTSWRGKRRGVPSPGGHLESLREKLRSVPTMPWGRGMQTLSTMNNTVTGTMLSASTFGVCCFCLLFFSPLDKCWSSDHGNAGWKEESSTFQFVIPVLSHAVGFLLVALCSRINGRIRKCVALHFCAIYVQCWRLGKCFCL